MTLHLVKLCVGIDDVGGLAAWQKKRLADQRTAGVKRPYLRHVTRNTPRLADRILDGGSLYWVIKGVIRCRQRITAINRLEQPGGVPKCELRLGRQLVRTIPQPCRPFQGWRYLEPAKAPADLAQSGVDPEMPEKLAEELRALGLL